MNVNVLASQLSQLQLDFAQGTIDNLNNVATCTAIEGVEVSQEELDALKEAADANAGLENDVEDLKKDFESVLINGEFTTIKIAVSPEANFNIILDLDSTISRQWILYLIYCFELTLQTHCFSIDHPFMVAPKYEIGGEGLFF